MSAFKNSWIREDKSLFLQPQLMESWSWLSDNCLKCPKRLRGALGEGPTARLGTSHVCSQKQIKQKPLLQLGFFFCLRLKNIRWSHTTVSASTFQECYLFLRNVCFLFSLLINNVLDSFPRYLYFNISAPEKPCSLTLGGLGNDSVSSQKWCCLALSGKY